MTAHNFPRSPATQPPSGVVGEDAGNGARNEFVAGYLIAVANIVHTHDEPVIAEDVLAELGVGKEALKGLDFSEFDLKPLRKLFSEIARKAALNRKRGQ